MFEDRVKPRKDIETSRKPLTSLTSKRWDRSDLIMFDWWRLTFDKSPRIFLIFLQCNIHIFGAKGWKTSTPKQKTIILRWQDQWCLERLRMFDTLVASTSPGWRCQWWRWLLSEGYVYIIHENMFEHFREIPPHHVSLFLEYYALLLSKITSQYHP